MRVIPGDKLESLTMDHDAMREVNSSIGSGGVIVMDETTCMVRALTYMMRFYHHESCGQCTPCREGSGWILKMLERVLANEAKPELISQIREVALKIEGKTICAFGEAISWPVTSFIDNFYEEFVYYAQHGKSMVEQASVGYSWDAHINRNMQ